MPNILTIVFLLALALPTALSIDNNQEISPVKFGDTISLELVQQETRFFTFTIPKLEVDKDLLIFARPRGYSNDPDLFLSTKNQRPTTALESDYSSQALGFSSINLPNEELEENVPYYLGVKCSTRTCSLNLTLEYQSDIYMEAEREHITLYYIKEKTQVIRAYVPEDSTIEHILFATEVQGQLDEQIYMYVNKGNETPDTVNYNVKSFIGWKDGKAAGVFKGDPNFCTGCNYTIAVEAPRDTTLLFSRKVYGPTRNLEVNTAGSNDALSRDANITYKVNLTTVTHTAKIPQFLTVQVTPYLGSLSTYVNFNEIPGDLKDSDYYIRHHSSERIEIDLVKLSSEGNLPEVMYVTVFGRSYSNFHIKVFTSDQDSILLVPGEFEFGTAKPDNVSNFLASVYSSGLFDMSIDVHADQGTVAVFVKRCLDKETCKFDNAEVTKILQGTTPTTTKDPLLLYTNVTHIDDYIDFSMDGTVCGTVNDPLCIFAVGVTPINERSPVNFTVAAVVKGEPRALKVNTPSRESIRMNDYSYYYFTVGNDENIEEVSFQITEISSTVFVYISREERYPDSRNHERPTRYNDLYSFDKEKFPYLNGTYYIAVTTLNSATYSILAKVRYANKDNNSTEDDSSANSTHILQLEQEVPQKITIQPGETSYFKFAVRQQEDDLEGVDILLTDVRGKLTLCVRNDGQLPQKDFCQWNATNNTLEISPTDPLFKADATYIVSVQSVDVAESHVSNAFVIGWTKFSSFKILDAGSIDGTVTKDYPQFYKIEVYPEEDKEIVIGEHTTSIADFVDLFVFNSRPGKNTNYRESANKTKVITEGQLIIDSSSISQLCTPASSRVVSKFCVLYIVITTNSTNEVKFNLALMKEPESIKIKDNTQTMTFFPAKYSPVHLYYYPSQRKDIIINVFSMSQKVRVYANIIDTDNYASLNKWPFPTEAKNEFASLSAVHPSVELHIPAYAMSACGAYGKAFTCAVALTVDYDEPSSAGPSQPNTFFVFASQEVIPIVAGRPYTSSIEPSQIKYYSLDVSKTQATLLVSVVCLTHCSNQVLIAKGADARPTPFGGYVQMRGVATSEVIQISDVEAPGNSMKGTWIIGVSGSTNSTFVLEVAFEEQKILTLVSGTPVEAAVPENQTLSFLYFHALNNVLNFRVTREKGAGKYWITKVNSSQTIEQNIASESHSLWSGSFSYSQDVIKIDPSDPNFCNFCKYLLTVAAEKDMKFSIVAYGKGAFTWLRPESIIRDYVDSSNPIRYTYSGTHDFLDLNLLIYSGEITVYVQTGFDVSETDYSWKRTASSGTKYIRLPLVNPENPSSTENNKNTHDTYNVLVMSAVPTNYSIGISFSNSTSFLYEGRQIFGFLNPKEMNNYMYFEAGGASTSPLKVQFVMYRDQFSILMNETERFPDFRFLHLGEDTTNITIPEVVTPFRNDIMRSKEGDLFYRQMLQYTQLKQGHYKFVVANNYDIGHFNYSLAVNSNAPLELPLNTISASRTAVGKSDLYIVHTGQPGTVVVEVHKCVGNVDILISNNHAFEAPVSSELGNVEENTLGSHIVFMTFSLEKAGSVYIKVTAIDGVIDDDLVPQKEAVYKIKADFYDAEKSSLLLPYKWFTAGKDGNLMWSFEGHNIQVEFDDVNYLQSNQISSKYGQINFTHTYDLFMTKDIMPAQYLSRCDMMPKREGSFKNMNMKSSAVTFQEGAIISNSENANHKVIKTPMEIEPNPAYITLRVTLSGTNKEGDHIWSYPIIYQTTMVSGKIGDTGIPEVNMRGLMTLIVVICVLIVVAVGVTYYYYSRYRRVKQILNYEVQDMSSLGGIESEDGYQERGIELGKMKYSGLPEQAE